MHVIIFAYMTKQAAVFFTGDTFGLSYREMDTKEGAFILTTSTPVQFEPDAWQDSLTRILDYHPQNMYLTHYGLVTEIDRLSEELRKDIDKYTNIAKQFINSDNQKEKITKGIREFLKSRLRKRYTEDEIINHMKLLNSDIELNAAGLEVWVKRLEKAA